MFVSWMRHNNNKTTEKLEEKCNKIKNCGTVLRFERMFSILFHFALFSYDVLLLF